MPQGLRDTGQQRVSWQEFPIEEYKWACPHWVLQGSTEPPAAISPCPELRKGAGPAQKLVSDGPRLSWLPFPGFHLPDSPPWGSESSLSVCSLVVSDNRPTPTFWSFASESPIYRFRKCVAKFSTLSQWGLLNALSLSHSPNPFLGACLTAISMCVHQKTWKEHSEQNSS